MNFLCPDSTINFFYLFDLSIAPRLLFYSYLPIIVVSLFFGFFVYFKSNRSLLGKNLLYIALAFSIFLINEIVQWIAAPVFLVNFGWTIAPLLQALVWFFTINFYYSFLKNQSLPFWIDLFLVVFLLPIIVLLPTKFNIISFDLANCQANGVGLLWYYLYCFQLSTVILLLFFGIKNYLNTKKEFKSQALLLIIGVSSFLLMFSLSNILGELLNTYEINLVGPVGMVLFIILLSYLIIQYKAFDIKVLGVKILVFGLFFLIASQFFFIQNNTNKILTAVTLGLVTVFGWWLVKSVKKEVEQREHLEKITEELKVANLRLQELDQQKTEFLSIASHQLRTPLSIMKGYVELIADGAYGKPSKELLAILKNMDESNERLVSLVDGFLDITRIEQGRTKYSFADCKINDLIASVVEELRSRAKDAGLEIIWKENKEINLVNLDEEKVRHVVFNFVDNAIKYTPSGNISVLLEDKENGVEVKVKDTGLGFGEEDQVNFFQKFYRGKNVQGSNVTGTGLGLFVCRKFIESHEGKVWAKSAGIGQGGEFGFWLPYLRAKNNLKDEKGMTVVNL